MLKYANMRELKEKTPAVLTNVDKGDVVIITYRGKPRAMVFAFNEDALEDYVFSHSVKFKRYLQRVKKSIEEGNYSDFREFLKVEGINV